MPIVVKPNGNYSKPEKRGKIKERQFEGVTYKKYGRRKRKMEKEGEVTGITTVTLNKEKLKMVVKRMGTTTVSAALRRLVDIYLGSEGEDVEDEELRELMEQKRVAEKRVVEIKQEFLIAEERVAELQKEIFGKIPRQGEKQVELKTSERPEVQEAYVEKVNSFIKANPEYREVWEFQHFIPEEVMEKYVGLHKGEVEELQFKSKAAMQKWLLKVTEGRLCVRTK